MQSRKEIRVTPRQCLQGHIYELAAEPLQATLVDISTRGAAAETSSPVKKGTRVCLSCGELELVGIVVRCERSGSKFVLGLELEHSLQRIQQLRQLNRVLLQERVQQGVEFTQSAGIGARSSVEKP